MALFRYNQTNNKLVPITSEGSVGIPVGAVMAFALGTQSPNWLLCDGRDTTGTADELQTKYPALYTYLGNSNVLPDYRECTLVGVGQNDTDTIADHDVYTLGEFKDDQLQNITGSLYRVLCNGKGAFQPISDSGDYNINAASGSIDGSKHNVSFDASRVARTGTTTHGKQKGVAFYIKATSAGIEVDRGLYATKGYVDNAVSYSTTEQPTGGTWIDGKPIYKISKEHTGNFSNSDWTSITLFDDNVRKNIVKLDIVCATTYLRPESLEITNTLKLSAVSGSGNGSAVYGAKYAMTVYYTKATD